MLKIARYRLHKIPTSILILFLITALGIFLRTYNFHDWLAFRGDQVRDAYLTDQVISGELPWPLMGPSLNYSGVTEETSFHMGPVYYYFQIISAKIFGSYPDVLAYPDVFFSILSIPLLFFLLRVYFSENISLSITGLYAISPYIIHYSRYAWSCNPIPFFVLLFVLSMFKLLEKNEKTHWIWAVSIGFSLGVGFQLHAITMIVFSAVTWFVFLFSMRKSFRAWRVWTIALLIFTLLNSSQIVSEIKTNFYNTKTFFYFFSSKESNKSGENLFGLVKNTSDCQIEANLLYISSYNSSLFGRSNCSHDYLTLAREFPTKNFLDLTILSVSLIFSIAGYVLLIYYYRTEKEVEKKRFLGLLILYSVFGYLVMLPLNNNDLTADLRYFSFVFFLPFIFLGFIFKFLSEKVNSKYVIFLLLAFYLPLFFSNAVVLSSKVTVLLNKNAIASNFPVLGELEQIVSFLILHSNGERTIYLGGNHTLLNYTFSSLEYLLKKNGIELKKLDNETTMASGKKPVFYIKTKVKVNKVSNYQKIGKKIFIIHQ